jgi:hypothetical protein
VLMSQGWLLLESGFCTHSRMMMPVTISGLMLERQRRKTLSQLYQRLSCSKSMAGWLPWPASKEARESKVAEPSWIVLVNVSCNQ